MQALWVQPTSLYEQLRSINVSIRFVWPPRMALLAENCSMWTIINNHCVLPFNFSLSDFWQDQGCITLKEQGVLMFTHLYFLKALLRSDLSWRLSVVEGQTLSFHFIQCVLRNIPFEWRDVEYICLSSFFWKVQHEEASRKDTSEWWSVPVSESHSLR